MPAPTVQSVLRQLLDPVVGSMTPEDAKRIVAIRADDALQDRMDTLADRNTAGELTPDERAEYEAYVAATNLVAVLQARAAAVVAGADDRAA